MKVIGYSAFSKPEVFHVTSTRAARRIVRAMRDRQLKPEIMTEREFNKNENIALRAAYFHQHNK